MILLNQENADPLKLETYFSYEIVHKFGGIYLDSDSQSLKPFDALFRHSFVCYDVGWNTLVHSVFGMPPGSKFLRFALESARLNFQKEEFNTSKQLA